MKEFEREISNPSLRLTGHITGPAPVQCEGTVQGLQFYFRARWHEWSFAISEDPNFDPVNIQVPYVAEKHVFLVEGCVGKELGFDASYLDFNEAQRIIEECCEVYLNRKE
jgi:hypothetical protein